MTLRSLLVGTGATSQATDLGLLVLRLGTGLPLAFAHGISKVPPSAGFIDGTAEMGFPLPTLFAWAAALSEFVGGMLIAAGLLTRPAALFAAFTMAVAFFVRHGGNVGEGEQSLTYLVAFVALLITGAGRYAVDRAFRRTPIRL